MKPITNIEDWKKTRKTCTDCGSSDDWVHAENGKAECLECGNKQ
jgi:hypothetical protein